MRMAQDPHPKIRDEPAYSVKPKTAEPYVLVADDDPDMREEVTRTLCDGGYEVMAMDSGDVLVEYLGKCVVYGGAFRLPDLVISDLRMPGFSGIEVLKAMREMAWNIPFILMTAFGDQELHEEARRLGAFAAFDKPFDADDLLTAVGCALGGESSDFQRVV